MKRQSLWKKALKSRLKAVPRFRNGATQAANSVELGADKLSDAELLSILISTGIKGKSAEKIAEEVLAKFGSFKGMGNQPLEKFLKIKGLGDVKIIRIAAALEIAKRCVDIIIHELKRDKELRKEVFGVE